MYNRILNIVLPLVAAVGLFSCRQTPVSEAEIVDVSKAVPGQVLISSFTSGVETVRLETSEDCMIGGIGIVRLTEDRIYIMDIMYRGIYIFDRKDGNHLASFKKQGRGPGEYIDISDFYIDQKEKTLEILDTGTGRIFIYDLQSLDFVSEITLPVHTRNVNKSGGIYYLDTGRFSNEVDGKRTNSGVIAFDPETGTLKPLFDVVRPEEEYRYFNIRGFSRNGAGQIFYSQAWDNTFYQIENLEAKPVMTVDPGNKGIPESIRTGTYEEQERFMQERRPGYMSFRLSYHEGDRSMITFSDGGKPLFYFLDGEEGQLADKIIMDSIEGSPVMDPYSMTVVGDVFIVVWIPGESRTPDAAAFLDRLGVGQDDNPVLTLFKFKK